MEPKIPSSDEIVEPRPRYELKLPIALTVTRKLYNINKWSTLSAYVHKPLTNANACMLDGFCLNLV